jgi:hypothetical protein
MHCDEARVAIAFSYHRLPASRPFCQQNDSSFFKYGTG